MAQWPIPDDDFPLDTANDPHGAPPSPFAPALALAMLSVVLSGCLASAYNYTSHTSPDKTDLYMKLPSTWTTFTESQFVQAANGKLSSAEVKQIAGNQWLMGFTGRQHAPANDAGIIGNYFPGGYTFAQLLPVNQRDDLSFSTMRAQFLGIDPLTTTSPGYTVLSYNEFTRPGGIRGSKMITQIGLTGYPVTTVGQVVEVDPQTNWLFGIDIGCRASCWGPNQGAINQILNTWQVKEEG